MMGTSGGGVSPDAQEMAEIDDDFGQAILLLTEEELQDKLFLLAHLLRLRQESDGLSKRAAADFVIGFLQVRKFR